jgi:predicted kinase
VQGRLLIFCGIPGSGKTTVAGLVAKTDPLAIHIQTDVIRSMIPEPNYGASESDLIYRSCVAVAKEWLDNGRLVILDGTFGTSRRRENTLAALTGHYSRVDYVHVVCDLETALRRNSARTAAVPEENVKGILSAFEPPTPALRLDTTKTAPEAAAEAVVRTLLYPMVPPE